MIVTTEEIRSIIGEADTMADMEALQNNVSLTEQGVDSLDMANIYLLIEEKFEVKLPDEDVSLLGSVDNIVNYLMNI
jgi:acyl carrier protein